MAYRASKAPRLYVSARSDLDLRPLLEGLKQHGAEPYVLSDVAPLGADIAQRLRLAIDQADRVLVVLTREPALNSVLEARESVQGVGHGSPSPARRATEWPVASLCRAESASPHLGRRPGSC